MEIEVRTTADGVVFAVRVSPRARRTGVLGLRGSALKVGIAAAPVDGAANAELVAFLAKALGVPRRAVTILRGETARIKTVSVTGVGAESVRGLAGTDLK